MKVDQVDHTTDDIIISPNVKTIDGVVQNPHLINRMSSFRINMYKVYFCNYTFGLAL